MMSLAKEPTPDHPSDEETIFSRKHSWTHRLDDQTPQTPRSTLISLQGPEGSPGRRRSSMSSKGLFRHRDDEDFMLMEVQVHTSSTFDNMSDEEEGNAAWGLLDHEPDNPELWRRNSIASTKSLRSSVGVKRPHMASNDYLNEEYQRTKLRFIESTLRSEQTRAIIQNQRSQLLLHGNFYPNDTGLYQSPRPYRYRNAYQKNDGNLRRLLLSLESGSILSKVEYR